MITDAQEVERLRAINREIVSSHNTLLVMLSRGEDYVRELRAENERQRLRIYELKDWINV